MTAKRAATAASCGQVEGPEWAESRDECWPDFAKPAFCVFLTMVEGAAWRSDCYRLNGCFLNSETDPLQPQLGSASVLTRRSLLVRAGRNERQLRSA